MFVEQVGEAKIGGAVHVCDDKALFAKMEMGVPVKVIPCSVCGKTRYEENKPTKCVSLLEMLGGF